MAVGVPEADDLFILSMNPCTDHETYQTHVSAAFACLAVRIARVHAMGDAERWGMIVQGMRDDATKQLVDEKFVLLNVSVFDIDEGCLHLCDLTSQGRWLFHAQLFSTVEGWRGYIGRWWALNCR